MLRRAEHKVRRVRASAVEVALRSEADRGAHPVWDAHTASVLWTDAGRGLLHRLDPADHADVVVGRFEPPMGAAVPRADGDGWVVALSDHVADVAADGSVRRRVALPGWSPELRVDSARADRQGRLWLGSSVADRLPGATGPAPMAPLYRIEADLVPRVVDSGARTSGMAWTSDGATWFRSDADARVVTSSPFDGEAGAAGPTTTVVDLSRDGATGSPLGLAADVAGCVWVALWDAGALHRYTPAGRLDTVVALPVSRPTGCCFAGPGSQVLYVTTATEGLTAAQRRKELLAGAVFAVDVGIFGVASTPFA